jgi:hypothetical protein
MMMMVMMMMMMMMMKMMIDIKLMFARNKIFPASKLVVWPYFDGLN